MGQSVVTNEHSHAEEYYQTLKVSNSFIKAYSFLKNFADIDINVGTYKSDKKTPSLTIGTALDTAVFDGLDKLIPECEIQLNAKELEIYNSPLAMTDAYCSVYSNAETKKYHKDGTVSPKLLLAIEDYMTKIRDYYVGNISKDDFDLVSKMYYTLYNSKYKNLLFKPEGADTLNIEFISQVPLYFDHTVTPIFEHGVVVQPEKVILKCKALLDVLIIDHENKIIKIVDLKSATKSILINYKTYAYYQQFAFYKMAVTFIYSELIANGYTVECYLISIQYKLKSPYFKVMCHKISEWDLHCAAHGGILKPIIYSYINPTKELQVFLSEKQINRLKSLFIIETDENDEIIYESELGLYGHLEQISRNSNQSNTILHAVESLLDDNGIEYAEKLYDEALF